jgi:hypothetical protein
MNYKEKAEQYVREKLPELMELSFGCWVEIVCPMLGGTYKDKGRVVGVNDWSDGGDYDHHRTEAERKTIQVSYYRSDDYQIVDRTPDKYKIIGRPIQLQHWLRVLARISPKPIIEIWSNQVEVYLNNKPAENILFDLTTGQPATDANYQAFCEIVGVQ